MSEAPLVKQDNVCPLRHLFLWEGNMPMDDEELESSKKISSREKTVLGMRTKRGGSPPLVHHRFLWAIAFMVLVGLLHLNWMVAGIKVTANKFASNSRTWGAGVSIDTINMRGSADASRTRALENLLCAVSTLKKSVSNQSGHLEEGDRSAVQVSTPLDLSDELMALDKATTSLLNVGIGFQEEDTSIFDLVKGSLDELVLRLKRVGADDNMTGIVEQVQEVRRRLGLPDVVAEEDQEVEEPDSTYALMSWQVASLAKPMDLMKSQVTPKQGTEGKRKVEILSMHRSGSSTVGQLFNNDPSAFYVNDPCAFLDAQFVGVRKKQLWKKEELCGDIVERVFKCTFNDEDIVNMYSMVDETVKRSAVLSNQLSLYEEQGVTGLKPVLEDMCERSSLMVVKETRPHKSPESGVMSVIVLRDPRAAANALMKKWLIPEYLEAFAEDFCKGMEGLVRAGASRGIEDIALVKFEDAVVDLSALAKRLYEWIGLEAVHPNVMAWVDGLGTRNQEGEVNWDNPLVHSLNAWKDELGAWYEDIIMPYCETSLSYLGYEKGYKLYLQ